MELKRALAKDRPTHGHPSGQGRCLKSVAADLHAVGWRERDWARFNGDELRALYGVEREPPVERARRPKAPTPQRVASRLRVSRSVTIRPAIWAFVAIAIAAIASAAYLLGPTAPAAPPPPPLQADLVGAPVSFEGTPTACTEIAYNTAYDGWSCLDFDENAQHLPVLQPPAYQGECADLVADQTSDRWECLAGTPLPTAELPSAVIPISGG